MIEDKLSKEERIRLEAVSQANLAKGMGQASVRVILKDAFLIEHYIRTGEKPE